MSQMIDMSREQAEELLVFLANDTLQGDERAAVEAVVEQDAGLTAELEALREMRHSLQGSDIGHSPGAFGLARLMRDIDAETQASVTHVAANRPSAPSYWKIAAVVLLGLFTAQSAFVYLQDGEGAPDLQLASGGTAVPAGATMLRVEISPDATFGEVATLFLDLELTIVEGPTAIGFYTLEALDSGSYDQALDVLSKRPDLLDVVE